METLFLVGLVAFISSVLSGISGGGGSLIMTPFYLFVGLTPQQIVGVGSVASLGLGTSSLLAAKGSKHIHKPLLWPLGLLTVCSTIAGMLVLPHIQSSTFEVATGILLIVLAPSLFLAKTKVPTRRHLLAGYVSYAALLFATALGGSVAPLLFIPLMWLMGLSSLQAVITRRVLGLVQAAIMFAFVVPQGFVLWPVALTALAGCYAGGHIGTKIALKKGERFVTFALASTMVISGIALLIA